MPVDTHGVELPAAIRIEKARASDVDIILGFIRSLAEYERLADACVATPEKLRQTLFGPGPAAEVLLAYDGSRAVGFALFFHSYSTFLAQRGLFLEDLFVLPDARDQGVGHALLSELARIALERDCARVEWAVLDWNELAIGFYRRIGAESLDDWMTFRLAGRPLQALAEARQPA